MRLYITIHSSEGWHYFPVARMWIIVQSPESVNYPLRLFTLRSNVKHTVLWTLTRVAIATLYTMLLLNTI